ncbi:MAG TPA: hypothetical protein VN041_14100 [Microbacterium sp.]|nr:hypothetical protein [Microbacterium sp.]
MADDYTPSEARICIDFCTAAVRRGRPDGSFMSMEEADAAFFRWLAAHDAQKRAEWEAEQEADDEPCKAEVWSWDIFRHQEVDPYWNALSPRRAAREARELGDRRDMAGGTERREPMNIAQQVTDDMVAEALDAKASMSKLHCYLYSTEKCRCGEEWTDAHWMRFILERALSRAEWEAEQGATVQDLRAARAETWDEAIATVFAWWSAPEGERPATIVNPYGVGLPVDETPNRPDGSRDA